MSIPLFTDSLSLYADLFFKQIEAATSSHNYLSFVTWDTVALLPLKLFAVIFLSLLVISKSRKFTYRHLKSFALLTFLSGVAIYGIGFNSGGCQDNYLALGWRACLSSLEMFTSHSDLIEVDLELHHNPVYMTAFCIIHFLAVCVSAIAIVKLFGYQLYSWVKSTQIRLTYSWNYRLSRWGGHGKNGLGNLKENKIFVFWSVNENSITLAESMRRKMGKKAILIFVSQPGDNRHGPAMSRFTFSHFFHTSNETVTSYIDRLEKMDALLMNAGTTVNTLQLQSAHTIQDFYSRLGLKNLGSMLQHIPSDEEISYYFLSDEEEENVEAVSAIRELYLQEKKVSTHRSRLRIYCHARRNSFNEKLLQGDHLAGYKIEIVDSSLLAVRQLRKDVRNQPVSFVDKDCSQGTVLSPYHALIIGFGEVGQDALRFLYEFASFIGEDGKEDMKHFYIADRQIESNKSKFLSTAPALQQKSDIEWWDNASVDTIAFWDNLKKVIPLLNQIVISVKEDKEAIMLLSQLCDFSYKYRKDFHNFQILVRIKDDVNADQVKRYGRCWAEKACDFIQVFGSTTSLFNDDVFSIGLQEREAKEFYYQYKYISNAFESSEQLKDFVTQYLQANRAEDVWERRKMYKDVTISHDEQGKTTINDRLLRKTADDDIELHYQEEQDFSNSWHKYTKCALVGVDARDGHISPESLPRFEELLRLLTRNEQNEYTNVMTPAEKSLIDHLSGCEHLRWTAKMELLGFVHRPGRKSLKAGTNACMVSYAELKKDPGLAYTIAYDTGVVELSFTSFRKAKETSIS